MRVGIDLDDTIISSRKVLISFLAKHYGLKYNKVKSEEYEYFKTSYEDYFDFAKENYDELVFKIKLKPGTIKYLKKIKDRGHEIYIITSRFNKEFKTPYETTFSYLIKNKIPFDKLIITNKSKGEVCLTENIDIFFDDYIVNYNAVRDVGVDVYLMDDLPNIKIKNVKRIFSIRDIYLKVKKKEKENARENNNR